MGPDEEARVFYILRWKEKKWKDYILSVGPGDRGRGREFKEDGIKSFLKQCYLSKKKVV